MNAVHATWAMLIAIACVFVTGLLLRWGWLNLLISIILGIGVAVMRVLYDPDPPAAPACVVFPLVFVGVSRLGAAVRRNRGNRK